MQVTLEDAHILAKQLKEKSSKIQSIELFGSVLKNRKGHDIDLLLITDEELVKKFWSVTNDIDPKWPPRFLFVREWIKKFLPFLDYLFIYKRKHTRQSRVSSLINVNVAELAEQYRPGTIIDSWLVPANWRSQIPQLTRNHNTLIFLNNAAKVAIKIA